MNAYIYTMTATDENGEKSMLYPTTKQEAVEGLGERLTKLEVVDITETEDTTLENSNAGRLLFTEIKGAMEQGENPSPTNPQEIRNVAISGIRTHDGKGNESTITFSQPIELYGMGDVQDILTAKQTKRRFGVAVFDGSSDEAWNSSSRQRCSTRLSDILSIGSGSIMKALCSHLTPVAGDLLYSDETINAIAQNGLAIHCRAIGHTDTVANWREWLANNPMTVVYELAEETTEELPIADQIALNSLQTFDGITYVEFISEIKPTFKAKYGTTEMGGMTLESLLTARSNDLRLSAVESAVINNI